jgi:thymidylate kinase
MIVLEGPDSSGKSTLAQRLHVRYGWPIKDSAGPIRSLTDLADRLIEYDSLTRVICDRHPVISGAVYDEVLNRQDRYITPAITRRYFEDDDWLVIECRTFDGSIKAQRAAEFNTPEFVSAIEENYIPLCQAYRRFFTMHRAHAVWRFTNYPDLIQVCDEYVRTFTR